MTEKVRGDINVQMSMIELAEILMEFVIKIR